MKKTQKRYSAEFKKEVIDYSLSTPKGVTEICREFDITPTSFYKGSGDSKAEMADEIRVLRKKLARAERDNEILKKAALILGEIQGNDMSK